MGARRQEVDLDGKDAMQWLIDNHKAITNKTFFQNNKELSIDDIQKNISGNDVLVNFVNLLKFLQRGISFDCSFLSLRQCSGYLGYEPWIRWPGFFSRGAYKNITLASLPESVHVPQFFLKLPGDVFRILCIGYDVGRNE